MLLLHHSDGSACHFAGRADHALGLELGERLLVLLVAPIDVAALVDDSRRPEKLVQALLEQRVLAAVLFGEWTMRRAWWLHPARACFAMAAVLGGGHGFSCAQSFLHEIRNASTVANCAWLPLLQ